MMVNKLFQLEIEIDFNRLSPKVMKVQTIEFLFFFFSLFYFILLRILLKKTLRLNEDQKGPQISILTKKAQNSNFTLLSGDITTHLFCWVGISPLTYVILFLHPSTQTTSPPSPYISSTLATTLPSSPKIPSKQPASQRHHQSRHSCLHSRQSPLIEPSGLDPSHIIFDLLSSNFFTRNLPSNSRRGVWKGILKIGFGGFVNRGGEERGGGERLEWWRWRRQRGEERRL